MSSTLIIHLKFKRSNEKGSLIWLWRRYKHSLENITDSIRLLWFKSLKPFKPNVENFFYVRLFYFLNKILLHIFQGKMTLCAFLMQNMKLSGIWSWTKDHHHLYVCISNAECDLFRLIVMFMAIMETKMSIHKKKIFWFYLKIYDDRSNF